MNDGRRREWKNVKGPIGAAVLSLQRLGWDMPSPFVVVDDWGEEIPLTRTSPAMLAELLRDATTRALERYAGARAADGDTEFEGRRLCADQVRQQLATDKKLTREGKAAAVSTICGAVMTYSRASAGGYLVQDICPMCGCRGDTLHHRIWRCQHPEVVAARNRVAPQWLQAEVARRPATQTRWVTGFFPHPGDTWPRPATQADPVVEFLGHGDPPRGEMNLPSLSGKVYSDGSCSQHAIKELRRAATAIVQHNPEQGGAWWRIRMAVPAPMPQSSQAAEYVALPLLQAYLRGTSDQIDLASDCSGVVKACNDGGARPFNGARLYAGILKLVRADTAWNRQVAVRKVPAHIDPRTVQGSARHDAIGNGEADEEAKKARELHPRPLPTQEQELAADMRRSRLIIRTIAATMPMFPSMPRERMRRRPLLREGATIRGEGGHEWAFRAGCWRCAICGTRTVKPNIDAELAHRRCPGPKMSMQAEAMVAKGHKVSFAEGDVKVIFCIDCGAYSARRAYGLAISCPGIPTKAGAQALARIRRGYQPWRHRRDAGKPRPRMGAAAAWSQDRGLFVEAEGAAGHGRRAVAGLRRDQGTEVARHIMDEARCEDGPHRAGGGADVQSEEDAIPWEGTVALDPMIVVDARGEKRRAVQEITAEGGHAGRRRMDHEAPGLDYQGRPTRFEGSTMEPNDDARAVAQVAVRLMEPACPMDVTENAEAKGIGNNATGAREGPGGAREDPSTALVAPTLWAAVTDAVTGSERAAAELHKDDDARKVCADRGKAATAPPGGAAAPPGGKECTTTNGPQSHSPQERPARLGAGPSIFGRLLHKEEGGGPAEEQERRREAPRHPSVDEVAHGGGVVTACHGGERPLKGLVNCALNARNEWDIRGGGTAACGSTDVPGHEGFQRGADDRDDERRRLEDHRQQGGSHRHGRPRPHTREHPAEDGAPRRPGGDEARNRDQPHGEEASSGHAPQQCGRAQGIDDRRPSGLHEDMSLRMIPHNVLSDPLSSSGEPAVSSGDRGPPSHARLLPLGAQLRGREVAPRRDDDGAQGGREARRHRLGLRGDDGGDGGTATEDVRHEKRRRIQELDAARPIWLDPPSWLYLPHMGIGGGACGIAEWRCQRDGLHGGSGAGQQTVAAAQIRGRGTSPGSGGDAARDYGTVSNGGDDGGDNVASGPRGKEDPKTKRGAGGTGRAGRADPHADIRVSLELHAERVAKKARLEKDEHNRTRETAAHRIAALRERVRARAVASNLEQRPAREEEGQGPAAVAIADEEVNRSSAVARSGPHTRKGVSVSPLANEWRTIEVPKIHLMHADPPRIRDDPAGGPWHRERGRQCAGADYAEAEGEGLRRDASAAAASCDAWHAIDGSPEPP